MCFAALSRKRFLERHRPGHDQVFWDCYLKKWLSYNRRAILLNYMRDPFKLIWFYDDDTSRRLGRAYSLRPMPRTVIQNASITQKGPYPSHHISRISLDERIPKDGNKHGEED